MLKLKNILKVIFTVIPICNVFIALCAQQNSDADNDNVLRKRFVSAQVDTTNLGNKLDCLINIFVSDDKVNLNHSYNNSQLVKKDQSVSYDTLGFNVRHLFSSTGEKILESYLNPFNNVEYIKKYHRGKLHECGFIINSNQKIGVWKYSRQDERCDSLVNYENEKVITFCDFFGIAKKFGMVGKNVLPNRTEFNKIAKMNNLSVKTLEYINNKLGWPSLDFIDQDMIIRRNQFNSIFSFSKKDSGDEWSVLKFLNNGDKRYCFGLTMECSTRLIKYYEINVVQ